MAENVHTMRKTKRQYTGQRFGRFVVIGEVESTKRRKMLCSCDCGVQKIVLLQNLLNGTSKSCGCLKSDALSARSTIHGKLYTHAYYSWRTMKQRCMNPNATGYENYGGRGIRVCKEWLDFNSFYEWAINNGYDENLSLDRIDVNGNYEPKNCKWSTRKEQSNNRRNNHIVCLNGERHTIAEWAEIKNVSPVTISSRLRRGWNEEDAINGK